MSVISIEMLTAIPYIDHASLSGRFLSCLTFHDQDAWHFWTLVGEPDDCKLFGKPQIPMISAWSSSTLWGGLPVSPSCRKLSVVSVTTFSICLPLSPK